MLGFCQLCSLTENKWMTSQRFSIATHSDSSLAAEELVMLYGVRILDTPGKVSCEAQYSVLSASNLLPVLYQASLCPTSTMRSFF
jgi:hypothetical protein